MILFSPIIVLKPNLTNTICRYYLNTHSTDDKIMERKKKRELDGIIFF